MMFTNSIKINTTGVTTQHGVYKIYYSKLEKGVELLSITLSNVVVAYGEFEPGKNRVLRNETRFSVKSIKNDLAEIFHQEELRKEAEERRLMESPDWELPF
ncbi:MAG: hypothetical protein Q4B32_08510 [Clostridia bacterium]|nr:hypothetical protein [Clostridia bacterium]